MKANVLNILNERRWNVVMCHLQQFPHLLVAFSTTVTSKAILHNTLSLCALGFASVLTENLWEPIIMFRWKKWLREQLLIMSRIGLQLGSFWPWLSCIHLTMIRHWEIHMQKCRQASIHVILQCFHAWMDGWGYTCFRKTTYGTVSGM